MCVYKYRLGDCWKSETWQTVYIDVVSEVECHPQDTCAQEITCSQTVTCLIHGNIRLLTSQPDQDCPKQHPRAAPAAASLVEKVTHRIILCSICFALSSMAQISIWTSLCFAFTKHFKKKKSVLWKFHLTVLGFSSHVCMYLLGLYRSFNLSFVLSVTIFCHIYSRTEKITLPKGGIVLIFASHLLFDFLFHW